MFDAIVFAGGGNRCYWQGGFYEALADRMVLQPNLTVGASAGAFACAYSLLQIGRQVRQQVLAACGPHRRNVDWAAWRAGGALYPVGAMYRALLNAVLDSAALARLQQITDMRIATSRLPAMLPPLLGAAIGIVAYQLEKHLMHPVHPRMGRQLGFRPEFLGVRTMKTPGELCDAILASSGVPPFMPVVEIAGRPAFDGGLVDNVPVPPLTPIEAAGGRTLVLLTRVYKHLPAIPGRTYVQPSRRIEAKQFDVTRPEDIRAAYELGLMDGAAFGAALRR